MGSKGQVDELGIITGSTASGFTNYHPHSEGLVHSYASSPAIVQSQWASPLRSTFLWVSTSWSWSLCSYRSSFPMTGLPQVMVPTMLTPHGWPHSLWGVDASGEKVEGAGKRERERKLGIVYKIDILESVVQAMVQKTIFPVLTSKTFIMTIGEENNFPNIYKARTFFYIIKRYVCIWRLCCLIQGKQCCRLNESLISS